MFDLAELPLSRFFVDVILFVGLRWLRRSLFSAFFVIFLVIFAHSLCIVCWSFNWLVFRWLFPWFSKFDELFYHICLIDINWNFGVTVRNIRIWQIRNNYHYIINIRNFDSSAVDSNFCSLNEFWKYLSWFYLKSIMDELSMILYWKSLACFFKLRFSNKFIFHLSLLLNLFIYLLLSSTHIAFKSDLSFNFLFLLIQAFSEDLNVWFDHIIAALQQILFKVFHIFGKNVCVFFSLSLKGFNKAC